MLESYLERLSREARKSLLAAEVQALIAESRLHLEDSIQSRIEMGATWEEAETQAIQAFGQTHDIGKSLRRDETVARQLFTGGAVGLIAFFGGLMGVSLNLFWGLASIAVWLGLHVALIVGSFRGRRLRLGTIAALFIATMAVSSVVGSFTHSTAGGMNLRRPEIPSRIHDAQAQIDAQKNILNRLLAKHDQWVHGELNGTRAVTRYGEHNSRASSLAKNTVLQRIVSVSVEISRTEGFRDELQEAITRPWWQELPHAPGTVFQEVWPSFIAYGGVHLFSWFFGVVWRDRNRRRSWTSGSGNVSA